MYFPDAYSAINHHLKGSLSKDEARKRLHEILQFVIDLGQRNWDLELCEKSYPDQRAWNYKSMRDGDLIFLTPEEAHEQEQKRLESPFGFSVDLD